MEKNYKESYKYKLDLPELDFLDSQESSTKVRCPSCDASVPSKNINIHDHIGKCDHCDSIFSIEAQVEHIKQKTKNELLKRPKGLEIFKFGNEIEFSLNQPIHLGEVLGVALVPFLAFVLTIAWLTKSASIIPALVAWIIALFFIVNAITIQWQKVFFIIDKSRNKFKIFRKPRKYYRNASYNISDILQFYVSKPSDFTVTMILNTNDGHRHINLVSGFKKLSEAKYLEQELEEHLGIENKKVPEEAS